MTARSAPTAVAYSATAAASVSSIDSNLSASRRIPGFRTLAQAYSAQSSATARAIACSRPPPPTNSTVSVMPDG